MSVCRSQLMIQIKLANISSQSYKNSKQVQGQGGMCMVAGEVGKLPRLEIEIKSNSGFATNSVCKKKKSVKLGCYLALPAL